MSTGARIILTEEGEWWVATDEETGVASQGRTRELALENLDEALEGFAGVGHPPTDGQLEAVGIDPMHHRSGDLGKSDFSE